MQVLTVPLPDTASSTASTPTVLCVGELLMDAFEMRDAHGRPIGTPDLHAGGAPANVSIALRKLGIASAFAGCVGADAAGDALIARLRSAGVAEHGVQRNSKAPTRIVRVARDAQGERTFLDFGGTPAEAFADACLSAQALPPELLAGVGLVVIGSLSQAYPASRAAIASILADARDRAIPVLLDVNRRPMFWPRADAGGEYDRTRALIAHAAYVKVSDEEARWLFQTHHANEIARLAPWLRGVVVTDGPREIAYHIDGVSGTLLPPKITAVDTTGAGDGFTAGWIARLFSSDKAADPDSIEESMRYASIVGTLATANVGAWSALPTRDEVEAYAQDALASP